MKKTLKDGRQNDVTFGSLVETQNRRALARREATLAGVAEGLARLGGKVSTTEAGPLKGSNGPEEGWTPPKSLIPTLPEPKTALLPWGSVPLGFYLAYGPPNSGKTVTLLGLAYWLDVIAANNPGYAYCAYHSISEPRSPAESYLENNTGTLDTALKEMLNTAKPVAKVAVLDSVGYAMRIYDEANKRGSTGAMSQGMSPMDQAFTRVMQRTAMNLAVVIGVVGSTEVPFVEALEGLVEGMITIVEPGTFTMTYRSKDPSLALARGAITITVPHWAFNLATKHLGYGEAHSATSAYSTISSR